MHFNVYDAFYSQCPHQHVSAGIPAIFRMMLLLQDYKRTNLVNCHYHSITIKLIISVKNYVSNPVNDTNLVLHIISIFRQFYL
jgi:hypothetical protein